MFAVLTVPLYFHRPTPPVVLVPADPVAWGVAPGAVEDLAKRTVEAKHFRNPDGTYTAVIGRHLHTRLADGRLIDRYRSDPATGHLAVVPDLPERGLVSMVHADTTEFPIGASGDDVTAFGGGAVYASQTFSSCFGTGTSVAPARSIAIDYITPVSLFQWDTSSLGSGATVTGANLICRVVSKFDTNSRNLIADWHDWGGTCDASDWTLTTGNDAIAGVDITAITTSADNSWALSNLGNISLTGATRLRLAISGGAPTGGNSVEVAAQDHATLPECHLAVTYDPPPPNAAPAFTAGPSDDGSSGATPTNVGANVSFTTTATDADGDQYYLAICKTNSITPQNEAPPTCPGGSWAVSAATAAAAGASATYTALQGDAESNAWHAFVCDHNAASLCSASSQGTGANGSPFKVNHAPSFSAVADSPDPQIVGSAITFTSTASDADTDTTADTVSLFVCRANDATSAGCGAGGTWCSSTPAASNPSCQHTAVLADVGTNSYHAFVFDAHDLAAADNPRSATFTVSAPPTLTSVTGQNPQTTAGGKAITLTGTAFVDGATVTVGGTSATDVAYVNATTLTAAAPAKTAGSYDVVVTNSDTQTGVCTDCLTYEAPPTLDTLTPTTVFTNGLTNVSVTGTNLKVGATGTLLDPDGEATAITTAGTSTATSFTAPAHGVGTAVLRIFGPNGTTTNGIYTDTTLTYTVAAQCQDSIDNDNDGLIDYPDDRGCTSPTDNDESGPHGGGFPGIFFMVPTPQILPPDPVAPPPASPSPPASPIGTPVSPPRDLNLEQGAIGVFTRLFPRLPNSSGDWRAVHYLAYGGMLAERSLLSEVRALATFARTFRRLPVNSEDWRILHLLAYPWLREA